MDAMNNVELGEYEVLEDMCMDGLKIVQDTRLYRFTSDSVLLSRFARCKKGEIVADFCAGSGIVGFHFYALHRHKTPNLPCTLFEMQAPLSALSKKTAIYNGFENFTFENCRLQDIPEQYRERFSLILCNPPYEKAGTGFDNESYEKAVCRKEITLTLEEIARAAAFALKYGGRIDILNRADRLPELCYTFKKYNIEIKKIQFVGGRYETKPYLVMVEGVKGGKPSCEIAPTICNE
ncbi:MAG: methyltransferase [Clostridia bacterium]|nr:methyltransferase [Clostridia bacterium]